MLDRFEQRWTSGRFPRWMEHLAVSAATEDVAWLDIARACLECGPGGDVDADGYLARRGSTWVPRSMRTMSGWIRLYERVQRGELGGPNDGARVARRRMLGLP